MTPALPLAGIRVIALEQAVAAPLCTRHLADLGADVVKVERPGEGDFARAYDTAVNGLASWFAWLNRGKRSLTLDLKQSGGLEVVQRLIAGADVVVQNFAPGALERLGLGVDQVRRQHPRLIACSITGYGEDGPYRDRKAYDLLLQGETGVLSVTGTPEQQVKSGVPVADISAGMYALSSILAALYRRRADGEGAAIKISLFDSLMEWMQPLASLAMSEAGFTRAGERHATIVPYGPYRVAGGRRVMFAIQNEREWARLCTEVLDRPEWIADPRFARNELRTANRHVLEPMIEEALADVSVEEAEARLEAASLAFARANDAREVMRHPQVTERGRLLTVRTVNGPVGQLRAPFNIEGLTEPETCIPTVGQHTDAILTELGYDADAIAALRREEAV
jgi:crotonobetainyl-CoA:carnitine CoA-transferase CaiB-like acyl-CoA transferase